MKAPLSLDDLALFLSVAESGGLAPAVSATGVSAPTLSRKMTSLERTTGQRLFRRGAEGYQLTAEGRALATEAAALRPLRDRLSAHLSTDRPPRVRITSGTWTARFIARHIHKVWRPGDPWVPEFISANAMLDLARREADIGIRSRRPEQDWLAGQRIHTVRHAIYGRDDSVKGYIALPEAAASTVAERWLRANHSSEIITTANTERLALDLARAGVGRMILPIFAGADGSGLLQLSDPVVETEHEGWIVSHHEARHDPPVRHALDALVRLFRMPMPGD